MATVVLDDTLCKGTESWAWYGLQPVHHALKPGGTLIVVSLDDAPALLKNIHRREEPYKLGIVKGLTSFSGMWVFKDDHTDVRILGAIAKAAMSTTPMTER
jgi:pyruvate ferredoxin oxidoreductase delta subunit